MKGLKGKVAIVTGSSRGFGAMISETFNRYGAKTVITYLDGDQVEKNNAEILAKKIKSDLVIALDVTKRESVKNLMEKKVKFLNFRIGLEIFCIQMNLL